MISVSIYLVSLVFPKDTAKIVCAQVLFFKRNFGLENFKVQYQIYKAYHQSGFSKSLHDLSFLSDAYCWFTLGNRWHIMVSIVLLSVLGGNRRR